MVFEMTSFVLGVAVGSILVLSIAYPRVGRILTRVLAVLALSAGIGLFTWALYTVVAGGTLEPIAWQRIVLREPSEAFGWSAGLVLAGGTALLLSIGGRSAALGRVN